MDILELTSRCENKKYVVADKITAIWPFLDGITIIQLVDGKSVEVLEDTETIIRLLKNKCSATVYKANERR